MNPTHTLALTIGLAWGVGSGAGSSRVAAPAAPAPCALLAPNEVTAALGETVGAGQPIATTGCSWTVAQPHLIVTLSLWPGSGWNDMKTPLPNVTRSPVTGVGDDAVSSTVGNFVSLSVKKGAVAFIVKVYGVPDHAKQAAIEKTLAQLVAGRL